jgi:hypothetical protein
MIRGGKRRNPDNWSQDDTRTAFILNRGYTMHEHLPEFNLINMNGRVYVAMAFKILIGVIPVLDRI